MARELGLNPRKFGQLDNYRQEPWKAPLPAFIEDLYLKRFGRPTFETVASVEDRYRQEQRKRATRRDARAVRRNQAGTRRPLGGLRAARPATSNDTPSTSRPRSEALSSRW